LLHLRDGLGVSGRRRPTDGSRPPSLENILAIDRLTRAYKGMEKLRLGADYVETQFGAPGESDQDQLVRVQASEDILRDFGGVLCQLLHVMFCGRPVFSEGLPCPALFPW